MIKNEGKEDSYGFSEPKGVYSARSLNRVLSEVPLLKMSGKRYLTTQITVSIGN